MSLLLPINTEEIRSSYFHRLGLVLFRHTCPQGQTKKNDPGWNIPLTRLSLSHCRDPLIRRIMIDSRDSPWISCTWMCTQCDHRGVSLSMRSTCLCLIHAPADRHPMASSNYVELWWTHHWLYSTVACDQVSQRLKSSANASGTEESVEGWSATEESASWPRIRMIGSRWSTWSYEVRCTRVHTTVCVRVECRDS